MKNFLFRLSVAAIFTGFVLSLSAQAAQKSATPQQSAVQQSMTAQQNDAQAQDAKPFNGTIVKEKGKLVLKDTTANVSYQLDDQEKAKQYEGKQVKITGKLDMASNLIHVESIEAVS